MIRKFYILQFVFLFVLGFSSIQTAKAQLELELEWATYYGQWAEGLGTLVTSSVYDSKNGFVYVGGYTTDSSGIATSGSFKDSFTDYQQLDSIFTFASGTSDAFLAKFDTLGNRLWATYYGGSNADYTSSLVVDTNGNIYVAGLSASDSGIATFNSFYPNNLYGEARPFLAKFDGNGQLLWSTFYGGHSDSIQKLGFGTSTAIDQENNIYLAGITNDELGIGTPGSHQELKSPELFPNIQTSDAYLLKFNSDGVKIWGTYYGGGSSDGFSDLFIDKFNNIYCTGSTSSSVNIASSTADQTNLNGYTNAFIVKFNKFGQRIWGTYAGGEQVDNAYSIIGNDKADAIYITGATQSNSGIADSNAFQSNYAGQSDGFLMKFSANGERLWGTYFGGSGVDFLFYFGSSGLTNTRRLAFDHEGHLLWTSVASSQSDLEKGCIFNPNHRVGILSSWDEFGQLRWSTYTEASLTSITSIGEGHRFLVTGATIYDSLATQNALQETKVTEKNSGYIAFYKGDYSCPPKTFTINQNGNLLFTDSSSSYHYQWYLDDQLIANSNSFSIQITDTTEGIYYVEVTDTCHCVYTSETLDLGNTSIVANENNQLNLKIYPNPNSGKFHVKGKLKSLQPVFYSITDVSGKVIESGKLQNKERSFEETLDCSYLKSGIYLIKFQQGQQNEVQKLIIF